MRSTIRLVCAVFVAVTLLAAPRPAAADDSLSVIAGAPPNVFDLLEIVAEGAGFYKQQHLNVEKNWTTTASAAAQLVATGKADVASLSVEPIIQGYDKGLRLQLFLSRQPRYSYVLAVLDDSPIKTLADFKGANLGETGVGSAAEPATESMLAGAGLKKGDYSFTSIGAGAQGLEAIVDKRVDGAAFPYTQLAQYEVTAHLKLRFFRHPLLGDVGNVGYAALPATIQAKADVLKRFSRAIVEAALFARENPEAAARLYLQLQVGGGKVTPEALANMTQLVRLFQNDLPAADPTNKRIGYFSPAGLELYSKLLTDYGVTRQVVPASAIVTDAFIPYANDFDHNAVIELARKMH
jgi:NitT/TauT family transport system substrate-binding protein